MSPLTMLLSLAVLLFLSAVFSGCETGVYSLSSVRLDAEARAGKRSARLVRRLTRNDTGLLITLLIGNNLMIELATHIARSGFDRWDAVPTWTRELVTTLALTPVVFFFAELLPKDLFRRRPHLLLGACAPLVSLVRAVFLPLAWPLERLSSVLERAVGVREREFARALGREEVLETLREGTREGALQPHAEELARNVLVLRETPVSSVMVPWSRVRALDLALEEPERRRFLEESPYTRLPAVRRHGDAPRVVGYLHVLEVLREEDRSVDAGLRQIQTLPPELPVDRALARLRISGQRLALVGEPASPAGLVTLMDLLARIAGDVG
jgi:CBS domain containing-hemolysin-like protein